MSDKQHVYAAVYGWDYRIERYDLVKETDRCYFVMDRYGIKTKRFKSSDRHEMFHSEDEATEFLQAKLQQRIESREKELAQLKEIASRPFRVTDESEPVGRFEGPWVL